MKSDGISDMDLQNPMDQFGYYTWHGIESHDNNFSLLIKFTWRMYNSVFGVEVERIHLGTVAKTHFCITNDNDAIFSFPHAGFVVVTLRWKRSF